MYQRRHLYATTTAFVLAICLVAFQNFTEDDQNEALDTMQIEDEVLQTSTDDLAAQQKEAQEQARLSETERANAQAKLRKTKIRREQVEAESKIKISAALTQKKRADQIRERYQSETVKLEKEISIIEQRIEKAERESQLALAEAKKAKLAYLQQKARRNELAKLQREKYLKLRRNAAVAKRVNRSLASVSLKKSPVKKPVLQKRRN